MEKGKLLRVQGGGGGFITQAPHGTIILGNPATDAGIRRGRGRTYHICGVLTQDYEIGEVPSTGMSGNGPHRRSDEGAFHVHTFSLECCSFAGWEGVADPL